MSLSIFPETWFFDVPVRHCSSYCFWINSKREKELNLLTEKFYELFKIMDPVTNYNLGIRSALYPEPFVSKSQWDEFTTSVKFLKSERFFDPYSPDIGSGRNVIFEAGSWKGVGRNHAAARIHHSHCSGYMTLTEAMYEVLMDMVVERFDGNMNVPLLGAFSYHDYDYSFIIRSSDIIRCGQIVEGMKYTEIESALNYLSKKIPNVSSDELFTFLMNRVAKLIKKGVFQTSPTKDNFCLDGRLVDNRTIDWIKGYKGMNFSCLIYFKIPSITEDYFINGVDWKRFFSLDIANIATPLNYFSSKFHSLKNAYKILGIPSPEWNDLLTEYSSFFNLPKCFFYFDMSMAQTKIKAGYDIFLEAEDKGASIKSYYINPNCVLLSIGSSIQKDVIKTFVKLLKLNVIVNGPSKQSQISQILNQVVKSHGIDL
jgi:hypothetical protein